jgi:hypothetical protein
MRIATSRKCDCRASTTVLTIGMVKHIAGVLFSVAFALSTTSCADVKQKQPPRIGDDARNDGMGEGSGDMDGGDTETLDVSKDDGPKETKAEKRLKCSKQCEAGIEDDTSGDPPGAIPCTKLTTKMDARCVVWFDKHPMTGGEAQAVVEDAPAADADGGEEGDGAKEGDAAKPN